MLHTTLAAAIVAITGVCFAYVIPELFNHHSTSADLLALIIAAGVAAFAYLAGRFVWRSFEITKGDEDEA